jgi:hypothetical protein
VNRDRQPLSYARMLIRAQRRYAQRLREATAPQRPVLPAPPRTPHPELQPA